MEMCAFKYLIELNKKKLAIHKELLLNMINYDWFYK